MRVTKSHTGNRRSHHAIDAPRLSVCSHCQEYHLRHNVCKSCGHYKGNEIISQTKKTTVVTGD